MAIRPIDQYPGQVGAPTAAYPDGVPRNVSAPSAGDGSPWEEAIVKDWVGFDSALFAAASITQSGVPDTALASQRLTALQTLFLQVSQLESQGGTILENNSRLPALGLNGLRVVRDSTVLMTTKPGAGRHPADDAESKLDVDFQKNVAATWAEGDGLGGMPAALHPVASNQFLKSFIVSKPNGDVDLSWDTSPVAANFFADANAIAAGFSDATRYRRYGYTPIDGSGLITDFHNLEHDPRRFLWAIPKGATGLTLLSANRTAINLGGALGASPPSCVIRSSFYVNFAENAVRVLISSAVQDDVAVTATEFTLVVDTSDKSNSVTMDIEVDSNQDIFWRKSAGTNEAQEISVHGWQDPGIIA